MVAYLDAMDPATTNDPEIETSRLAEHLRLWIVIGGYALGGWGLFEFAISIAARGSPLSPNWTIPALLPIHWLATALWMVSPLLLVVGAWGFQHHRPWARNVLLTYAALWMAGLIGTRAFIFVNALSWMRHSSLLLQFAGAFGTLNLPIYGSVFPVLLVLCLMRPEVRDSFPEFRPGFAPVLKQKEGE